MAAGSENNRDDIRLSDTSTASKETSRNSNNSFQPITAANHDLEAQHLNPSITDTRIKSPWTTEMGARICTWRADVWQYSGRADALERRSSSPLSLGTPKWPEESQRQDGSSTPRTVPGSDCNWPFTEAEDQNHHLIMPQLCHPSPLHDSMSQEPHDSRREETPYDIEEDELNDGDDRYHRSASPSPVSNGDPETPLSSTAYHIQESRRLSRAPSPYGDPGSQGYGFNANYDGASDERSRSPVDRRSTEVDPHMEIPTVIMQQELRRTNKNHFQF